MKLLNSDLDIAKLSAMLKALGDPTRLEIYLFLRDRCATVAIEEDGHVRPVDGPTVGEVCCHVTGLDKISSTISFHLKELRICGLIRMDKRGRFMVCCVNPEAIESLKLILNPNQSNQTQEACCE